MLYNHPPIYEARFHPEVDPWTIYHLASFAVRNPDEDIIGLYGLSEQLFWAEKARLRQCPSDMAQPAPGNVEAFREFIANRLPVEYGHPDDITSQSIAQS